MDIICCKKTAAKKRMKMVNNIKREPGQEQLDISVTNSYSDQYTNITLITKRYSTDLPPPLPSGFARKNISGHG